ncbi:MAG: ogr/Delta-like zinc finger family protein [Azoarcus sp.]|nr:ogr/Delta-like zinc finger family protein [Azoarcus sp.]
MRITCPHCGKPGKIRTSRMITSITREAYVQCENIDCCHVWKVIISAVSTIVPPLIPNSEVFIPEQRARNMQTRQLSLLDK